jgi:hypothetical protein
MVAQYCPWSGSDHFMPLEQDLCDFGYMNLKTSVDRFIAIEKSHES